MASEEFDDSGRQVIQKLTNPREMFNCFNGGLAITQAVQWRREGGEGAQPEAPRYRGIWFELIRKQKN